MIPEQTFLTALAAFWIVLYLLGRILRLEKHGLEIKPVYFMYRSKSLKGLMEKVTRREHAIWKTLSNVGLTLGVGLTVFSVYFFANNLLQFAYPAETVIPAPIFPVLPGITIKMYWLPYFLVSAAIVFLTHEVAHGVAARLEKIPLKSTGIFMFLVFLGAFVEPDEKEFESASTLSKLRMLSAGSSTNLVTGLLVMLLANSLFVPASGVLIQEVLEGKPAEGAGLQQWDVIYAINGTRFASLAEFQSYMANVTPGQRLTLETNKGIRVLNAAEGPGGRAVIGVVLFSDNFQSRLRLGHLADVHLYLILLWVHLLAVSLAVVNMLPIYPFDGEKFLYYAMRKVTKREGSRFRFLLNGVFLTLLASNIALSFIKYGLPPI